jgi:hypothetical protein
MQFKSVYTKENLENIPNKGRSPYPYMPKIQVTEQGVHKLLKKEDELLFRNHCVGNPADLLMLLPQLILVSCFLYSRKTV